MSSDKPPLVLIHGISSSGSAWDGISALLAVRHEVFTPTVLGHKGGSQVRRRPVTIWDVVDDVERYLDEQRLDRPHVVGHSMGGFVALELARRGRARTVCALSPGGFWSPGDGKREHVARRIRWGIAVLRVTGRVVSALFGSATVRRLAMSGTVRHPERMTAAQARQMVGDSAECTIAADLFTTADQQVEPLDPLPCPVTIAWAEEDGLLPLATYETTVRDRLPGASFVVLPGAGHVPMIDDPQLVARTILATTGSQRKSR